MNEDSRLAAAEFAAEAARERFLDSFHELVRHLEPKRLAKGLWEDAKVKGADLAEEAVDAVKARPVAATGVVAALALFLAREPIIDLAGKMMSPKDKKRPARKPRQPKKPAAPSAPSETMESKS
jgi:hypothetical protein